MLSNLIGVVILVAGFAVILERVRLVPFTRKVISLSRASVQTLRNPALSDDEKERLTQANTIAMFKLFAVLLGGMALALLVPLIVVWVFDRLGWVSLPGVLNALTRWDVIVVVSIVGIFIYWMSSKWRLKTT